MIKHLSMSLKSKKPNKRKIETDLKNEKVSKKVKKDINNAANNKKLALKSKKNKTHPKGFGDTPEDNSTLNSENTKNLKKFKQFKKKDETKETKPVWKQFKKEKKSLKLIRKQNKRSSFYDTTVSVKKLWEELRRSDCSIERREELITQIYDLLKNKLHEVVFTHDLARVVQWILKMGKSEMREKIAEELKPHILTMVQSKYSRFCVKNMLKYSSVKTKSTVIESFYGHVVHLMCHQIAGPLIEYAYSTWASPTQKNLLRQEFFGSIFKVEKDNSVKSLKNAFEKNPSMKDAFLQFTKSKINKIFNKKLCSSGLFHSVIFDYLSNCSEQDQREVFTQLHGSLLEFLSTKDGTRAVMMSFWFGTSKDRKTYMKTLKGHIKDVATSEHGHLALLALFDSTDDTVLLKKIVFPELIADLKDISANEYGRRVILYLLAHRDPLYFHPAIVDILKQGDNSETSKKDPAVRESELLDGIISPVLQSITQEPEHWLHDNSICMVTLAALKAGKDEEELRAVYKSIISFISNPNNMIKEDDKEYHAVEHSGLHLVLKKLILHEEKSHSENIFTSVLLSELNEPTIEYWISYNRGCFLLIMLFERGKNAQDILKKKISKRLRSKLKCVNSVGGKILFEKLSSS